MNENNKDRPIEKEEFALICWGIGTATIGAYQLWGEGAALLVLGFLLIGAAILFWRLT